MRSTRAIYVVLPLIVAVLGVAMSWQLATRSTIPISLHGQVVWVRSADQHPGHDNAWFVRIGEHTHQVDTRIGHLLRAGDRVDKDAWDDTLLLNGKPVSLSLSDDARASLWFAPLLTIVAAGLSWTVAKLSRRIPRRSSPAQ